MAVNADVRPALPRLLNGGTRTLYHTTAKDVRKDQHVYHTRQSSVQKQGQALYED